eukprot:60650_1
MASQTELLELTEAQIAGNSGTTAKEPSPTPSSPSEEGKYAAQILRKIQEKVAVKSKVADPDQGEIKEQSVTISSISDINNPNWRTPGDRELRQIIHSDGFVEKLYFTPDKYHHKKLFISFTIDTVAVDTTRETFRLKFYLQFNWIPSESDYRSLYKAAVSAQELGKPEILSEWVPAWIPDVEFGNTMQIHAQQWTPHPLIREKGCFRLSQYKKWGNDRRSKVNKMYQEQEFDNIKWICAEMMCDITFREELELYSYPFDVQDLTCKFRLKSKDTVNYTVFSYPNYFNADATTTIASKQDKKELHPNLVGWMDPSFSPLDEWDVANCMIEFEHKKMVLSVKLVRRWRPIVINTLMIVFLVSALSFTVFTVDYEDAASRLELTMTLILTAVLFDTQSAPKPYLTYLDKYIFTSYVYLTAVMIENAVAVYFDQTFDNIGFWFLVILFSVQHIVFISYAIKVRNMEKRKILMRYDEVKKFNKKREVYTPKLVLQLDEEEDKEDQNETHIRKTGINKYRRVLSVSAQPWPVGGNNTCCCTSSCCE